MMQLILGSCCGGLVVAALLVGGLLWLWRDYRPMGY